MANTPDKLRAVGEMVVIRFEEVKKERLKTAAGIEVFDKNEEPTFEAIIDNMGDKVPEDCGFKVGDSVMFNEIDLKMFEVADPNNVLKKVRRGVCRYSSIWGVFEKS